MSKQLKLTQSAIISVFASTATIELLIQDNSGFVTGATWDMNGGLLMR
ncbi:hypothetical protein AB6B34_13120 [Acinetobacter baumannii]